MTKAETSRATMRESLRLKTRYIVSCGVVHIARESDGRHHMTVCGKFASGQVEEEVPKGAYCHECHKRFYVGHVIAEDCEQPPIAVRQGRGGSVTRINGKIKVVFK